MDIGKTSKLFLLSLLTLNLLAVQVWADVCMDGTKKFVCGELIVQFANKASHEQVDQVMDQFALYQINASLDGKIKQFESYKTEPVPNWLETLRQSPGVLSADLNYFVEVNKIPNDPYYDNLWGVKNTGTNGEAQMQDLMAEAAWDFFTGDEAVVIAVIDTGVDYQHEDLQQNIWTNPYEVPNNNIDDDNNGYIDDVHGYDFVNDDGDPMDDHGHGTHCAGTIAAVGDNALGVVGVNWQAKIMALKFLSASGSGSYADAILAFDYARSMGVKITSNSWGGWYYSTALDAAIQRANQAGMLVIAAAGNNAVNTDYIPQYPSAYTDENIISVAALNKQAGLAYFSNYGKVSVDIAAPGVNILSTYPGDYYAYLSGTSMATPHVAGVAAMLQGLYPEMNHREMKQYILMGGSPLEALTDTNLTGRTLNLMGALEQVDPGMGHQAPMAIAGSDQILAQDSLVQLNGSGTDADQDEILFSWEVRTPDGEIFLTTDWSSNTNIYFTAQQLGVYQVKLMVKDTYDESIPDYVQIEVKAKNSTLPPTVSFEHHNQFGHSFNMQNGRPIAELNETIVLDASQSVSYSSDVELNYEWNLITKPANSLVAINNSNQSIASLYPDVAGDYQVQLQISDDISTSIAEVSFLVTNNQTTFTPVAVSTGGCSFHHAKINFNINFVLLGFVFGIFFVMRKSHSQ